MTYGYEQKVGEPKLSKCGTFTTRTVKFGNKVFGHIEAAKAAPGRQSPGTYWAIPDTVRLSPLEDAIRVTRTQLAGLRSYGVAFLGVSFPDGSSYVAELERLQECLRLPSDTKKPYFLAPRALWVETLPSEEERVANTMSKMKVGRQPKSSMTYP